MDKKRFRVFPLDPHLKNISDGVIYFYILSCVYVEFCEFFACMIVCAYMYAGRPSTHTRAFEHSN